MFQCTLRYQDAETAFTFQLFCNLLELPKRWPFWSCSIIHSFPDISCFILSAAIYFRFFNVGSITRSKIHDLMLFLLWFIIIHIPQTDYHYSKLCSTKPTDYIQFYDIFSGCFGNHYSELWLSISTQSAEK